MRRQSSEFKDDDSRRVIEALEEEGYLRIFKGLIVSEYAKWEMQKQIK